MQGIEVKDLRKVYNQGQENEVVALDGASFSVKHGEFVVILGASGAGKSTLLNILGGMDKASSGSYLVDGNDVVSYNNKELSNFRRNEIGFVFQFYNLMPNLTALENVQLAASVAKNAFDAKKVLEDVGLAKRVDNFPSQLSGGEQQRVAIARAIVNQPKILLADEPTGNLDPHNAFEIMKLIDEINHQGTTVLVVTHNKELVDQFKKRVIMMRRGTIARDVEEGGYIEA